MTRAPRALFGTDSPPGASQAFRAERDAIAIVAAPGGRVVDGDLPASALVVEVRRATPRPRDRGGAAGAAGRAAARLPRGPRLGARVRGAGRRVHPGDRREGPPVLRLPRLPPREAREGPRARARRRDHAHADGQRLSRARGSRASSTTWTWTRSWRWCATPSAATTPSRSPARAKYYEDMGYPGHISCTENFNAQVTPYGIAERKGWEALNFFYNTGFDCDNLLFMDEPWSRPGRLRAAAGDDRPGLRVVGLPGRHRPRQRLGDHRRPRARVLAREPLLDRDRPPRDPGG